MGRQGHKAMKPRSAVHTSSNGEGLLFLRRWLANPLKVGALLPSSPALARSMAKRVKQRPGHVVVEFGAGTGSVTKSLLEAGVPADRLFVIEIDPDMAAFLRKQIPQAQVVLGDATRLADLIPRQWHGKVSTVVSGIPMVPLPIQVQQRIVDSCFEVMAPGGHILQYTYVLTSPLPAAKLGLKSRREDMVFLNVPPASVWSFKKAA
jgi:phosphatidylethanolamine/phosphatidyl-N-methylethanolamine N-methyltransferase